jgi:hypothetical protein
MIAFRLPSRADSAMDWQIPGRLQANTWQDIVDNVLNLCCHFYFKEYELTTVLISYWNIAVRIMDINR